MRVVLVTHDSVFGRFMAATLYQASAVDLVLVERSRPSWRFYWRKLRRVGPVDAVFQAWLARWYRRVGARHLPDLALPPHESIKSANGYPFHASDLVIGFGTSYISRDTLARLPNGFLNLHTGYLPDYRGVKSEFWALARRDLGRLAWTLHYMALELDSGDIIVRRQVTWEGESPAAMRAKLLRSAAPGIAELLRDVRSKGVAALPRTPQGAGAYYTTPRLVDWRRYRRRTAPPSLEAPLPNDSAAPRARR